MLLWEPIQFPQQQSRLKCTDCYKQESATGDGSVDACFNAIERALDTKA